MAATEFPEWFSLSKEDLAQTEEWKQLASELFEAVQQQLTENHVSYFSDLTDSEKVLFLDRAAKLVRDGLPHSNLVARVSGILDRRVNEAIIDELMSPSNDKTKTELVLNYACGACTNLLQKWPDLRSKLYSCLNRPLPSKLRQVIWEMLLANPKIKDEFIKREKLKSNKTSTQDPAVAQRCEAFLFSEPSFQNLSKEHRSYLLQVMTNALVYRQTFVKNIQPLGDTDYLLAIPFLKVAVAEELKSIDSGSNHSDRVREHTAKFIEVYFTFMDSRPSYMKDSGNKEFYTALKQVGTTMASMLESQDDKLASFLLKTLSAGGSQVLSDCLATLMRSYLRCMFVGYVGLDVLCYIWDQYILSVKLPKFQCIPTFAVVMLMLLRNQLMSCRNAKEVEDALLQGARGLRTRQFQNEIDDRFMADWRRAVNEDVQGSELPLVDPVATLGTSEPWTWWFQQQPPSRQRPEDRRAAREEREAERMRLLQQRKRQEQLKRKEEEQRIRAQEEALRNTFDQEKKSHLDAITELKQELRKERDSRYVVEQDMGDEIQRLRDELARLQGPGRLHGLPVSGAPSTARSTRLPPTPRSAQSQVPGTSGEGGRQVQQTLETLVKRTIGGVQQLAHGTEEQRSEIQRVAGTSMRRNAQEYKDAEMALFGRELSREDWNEMTDEDRETNKKRFVAKLKEIRTERERVTPNRQVSGE